MKRAYFLVFALLLSACIETPTVEPTLTPVPPRQLTPADNPFAPADGDQNLQRGGVTLTSVNLAERFDLTPRRVAIYFLGSMPSVCSELRIAANPPDDEGRVFLEVYSLMDPGATCDRVFQQFEATILLGTYANGRYTVWVNGELIGDFVVY
jgi:hypothetical protein